MQEFATPTTYRLSPQVVLIRHRMTEPTKKLRFPHGVILPAGYFNFFTKKLEREHQISISGDVTIYLASAEDFPGWCYLQLLDKETGRFRCTCYQRPGKKCKHRKSLESQNENTTVQVAEDEK